MRRAAAVLTALLLGSPAAAQAPDWAAVLRQDAQGLHDVYLDSHPGPVDPREPEFRVALEAGLKAALARADQTTTYGGYRAAMSEYVAAFNDGHVQMGPTDTAPPLPTAWPGFLTRMTLDDRHVVAVRLEEASAPPLGAELVSCDGKPAAALAERRVARVQGRWNLRVQRFFRGPRLFVDYGDPWAAPPRSCDFAVGGATRTYGLAWRPIAPSELTPQLTKAIGRFMAPVQMHAFGPRRWWISLGSFDSTPGSDSAKKLTALLAEVDARKAELRAAELIVLDLRGNNGGSSHYSERIAQAIWGPDWTAARAVQTGAVDWRASQANIDYFARFAADLKAQPGHDEQQVAWVESVVAGMRGAKARGEALWREPAEPESKRRANAAPATRAKVVFVTDSACASACLDAADLWRAAGAVHVGHETGADSLYMDVRPQTLPSGYLRVTVPMKVYRDRPRGSNVPYRPHVAFPGDLADTGALETWILQLPN